MAPLDHLLVLASPQLCLTGPPGSNTCFCRWQGDWEDWRESDWDDWNNWRQGDWDDWNDWRTGDWEDWNDWRTGPYHCYCTPTK